MIDPLRTELERDADSLLAGQFINQRLNEECDLKFVSPTKRLLLSQQWLD